MNKKQECSREEFTKSYKVRIASETMTPRTETEKKRAKEARNEFIKFMNERVR